MTLWCSRERYRQGSQRTDSYRTLVEGYFLQWKDTAYNRAEDSGFDSRLSQEFFRVESNQ